MFIHADTRLKFTRRAAIALLAGLAWFSAARALAQKATRPDDSSIQSAVTSALQQDSALKGQQVAASAAKGVVTLTGTVQTEAQRQQAETDAANVSGVSGIMNNIKVTNPSETTPAPGLAAQASADQLAPQDQTQDQNQDQNQPPPPPDQNQQQAQDQNQNSVPPPPPPDENQPQQSPGQQPYQQQGAAPPPYQQQGYGRQYPQQGYGPSPRMPYYTAPSAPVTIPAGALLRVRLSEPLDTARVKEGTIFQATVAVDVYENGVLAIPRGAVLTGQVVESKPGGHLGGSAVLALKLLNVQLQGKTFPLDTDVWSSKGPNKAGYTAGNTAGGAVIGALIGGLIGRGAGAAVGAGVGALGGLAASGATNGPRIYLPAEATLDFHLADPATVQPVSWQEAQRLAASAPAQPVLVRRPRPVYVVPGPYYGPYAYAYPYPY